MPAEVESKTEQPPKELAAYHARLALCQAACAGFENPGELRGIVEFLRKLCTGGHAPRVAELLAKLDKPVEDKEEVSA